MGTGDFHIAGCRRAIRATGPADGARSLLPDFNAPNTPSATGADRRPRIVVRALRACPSRTAKGWNVSTVNVVRLASLATLCVGLIACATPNAPGMHGRWKPVNRFAEAPEPLPLFTRYVFQASPADGTLKTMLERWAADSKMALAYEHGYDFTLHQSAAAVSTTDLQEAVSQLSAAYAGQGVQIVTEGNRIVVRSADGSIAGATAAAK